MARGTAREKVRTARALRRLPLTSRAMARGEISFSKVRAVSRLVDDIGVDEERAQRIAEAGDILKVDLSRVAGLEADGGQAEHGRDDGERAACTCDAQASGRRAPAPISGTRAQRYQVVLHVDMHTLRGEGDGEASHLVNGTLKDRTLENGTLDDGTMVSSGRSHLEDGTRVSPGPSG